MNILILSQYFYPEEFKVNDLAEDIVKKGHNVIVLTGKPNYPKGDFFKGYKFWGVKKEEYKGAKVIRVPIYPRKNGGSINLILNYFSFVLFAGWYVLTHKINVERILCFETSPIVQMYPALWLSKRLKCKSAIWIQDLWPESVSAVGKLNYPIVINILNRMVKYIYKNTDILFVQSKWFKQSICEKGDFQEKIVYVPNWAEDLFCNGTVIDKDKYKDLIPKGFILMFAGNIGVAQDFNSILKAATYTKEYKDIHWVILGDGRNRKAAEEYMKSQNLEDTVHFLGRYPVCEMPDFFVHADAMLVSLRDEYIFSLTIPSKTQSYMAFGKPILSMLNGVGNELIKEAECGLTANAGDAEGLAKNVIALYNMDKGILVNMGKKGKNYYDANFQKNIIINNILESLK